MEIAEANRATDVLFALLRAKRTAEGSEPGYVVGENLFFGGLDVSLEDRNLVTQFVEPAKTALHPPVERTADYFNMLLSTSALTIGHFEAPHGEHSAIALKFSRVGSEGKYARVLAEDIYSLFAGKADRVLAPITSGGLLVNPLARLFSAEAGHFDVDSNGLPIEIRRGYEIKQGERILIVNDLADRGDSLERMIGLVHGHTRNILGLGVFATLGEDGLENFKTTMYRHNIPIASLVHLEIPAWIEGAQCHLCQKGYRPARPIKTLALNS